MPATLPDPPSPYQVAAWLAAAIAVLFTAIQLFFSLRKDRRAKRVEQARFGYQLLDDLFGDETATGVLHSLDKGHWTESKAKSSSDGKTFHDAFLAAFGEGFVEDRAKYIPIRLKFDSVLYYFDRIQHAIEAGLTTFEDIRAPLTWYIVLLRPVRSGVERYAQQVAYGRVLRLFAAFPEWDPPRPPQGTGDPVA
jgi:predicted DNA-binding ArsR family transcriptional regulator